MYTYFDYSSTTPVNDDVLNTYFKVLKKYYVNSDSIYPRGVEVYNLMEKAREKTASLLNVLAKEVIFTCSGSEANNLAIKGTALKRMSYGKHIIASNVEHSSVENSLKWLKEYLGFEVTYLPVNQQGVIETADLIKALREDTILVTVMYVNNESGAVMPIEEIKRIVRKYPACYLHCDCVQAVGKIDFDLTDIDLASISAHKIYGLKGSGVLVKKQHVQIAEVISGGQQEFHLRGGTSNAAANIVFAKTLRLALEAFKANKDRIIQYHDYLLQELKKLDKVVINSPEDGCPAVVNFSCLTVTSQVMMNALSLKGFEVSASSTCDSSLNISRVIAQMYQQPERLQ
ncbi:MAG TPA: cysteine desulfurase family protein, partial [Erysipelotrichaceae bacterium]|nr:cysteine desulfurase family protein [Erysipelotrichaceae bacterium]